MLVSATAAFLFTDAPSDHLQPGSEPSYATGHDNATGPNTHHHLGARPHARCSHGLAHAVAWNTSNAHVHPHR